MVNHSYSHILFDLDGTLFDYQKAEKYALSKTFEDFNLSYNEKIHLPTYIEINISIWKEFEQNRIDVDTVKKKRFDILKKECNLSYDVEKISEQYLTRFSETTFLYDDAVEILHYLKQKYHLILITNGLASVQWPRIKKSNIEPFFKTIIISEEVGAAKPSREIFDATFKKAGINEKNKALIIGDTVSSDILGGIDYGIHTCWFNNDYKEYDNAKKPTLIIRKLNELYSIL